MEVSNLNGILKQIHNLSHKKTCKWNIDLSKPYFFNYENLKLLETYSPKAQFHTTQNFKQVMSTKKLVFVTFMQVTYRVVRLVFSLPCHLQVDYKSITSCNYHHPLHESLAFGGTKFQNHTFPSFSITHIQHCDYSRTSINWSPQIL
jgi:hypothetical protein